MRIFIYSIFLNSIISLSVGAMGSVVLETAGFFRRSVGSALMQHPINVLAHRSRTSDIRVVPSVVRARNSDATHVLATAQTHRLVNTHLIISRQSASNRQNYSGRSNRAGYTSAVRRAGIALSFLSAAAALALHDHPNRADSLRLDNNPASLMLQELVAIGGPVILSKINNSQVIEFLIDKKKNNILHIAIMYLENAEHIRTLANKYPESLTQYNTNGHSPLMLAIQLNKNLFVQELAVLTINAHVQSLVKIAKLLESDSLEAIRQEMGIENHSLVFVILQALLSDRASAARIFRSANAQQEVVFNVINSALNLAINNGNVEIVDILMRSIPQALFGNRIYSGLPLMNAIRSNRSEILKRLLDGEKNINNTDDHGNNVLHVALISNSVACIQILMSYKSAIALLNKPNRDNETPLAMARRLGNDAARFIQ